MKWVADSTGHFKYRPHYDAAELDAECESLVCKFLADKYGVSRFPIATDDLSVMIERDTSDLDLYADLSSAGDDVEGVTEFFADRKPAVKIAKELSLDTLRHHRLRTTLAHEYGHVKFHAFLWDTLSARPAKSIWGRLTRQRNRYERVRAGFGNSASADRAPVARVVTRTRDLADLSPGPGSICKRALMLDAPLSDWMEWQASYVSGAILMPASSLRGLVGSILTPNEGEVVPLDSPAAGELAARVSETFDVSQEAARVRLTRLGFLQQ